MNEAKLVQGTTLSLTKNSNQKEKREVLFNFRIYADYGLVKSIGKYNTEDYLIDCLQNISIEPSLK